MGPRMPGTMINIRYQKYGSLSLQFCNKWRHFKKSDATYLFLYTLLAFPDLLRLKNLRPPKASIRAILLISFQELHSLICLFQLSFLCCGGILFFFLFCRAVSVSWSYILFIRRTGPKMLCYCYAKYSWQTRKYWHIIDTLNCSPYSERISGGNRSKLYLPRATWVLSNECGNDKMRALTFPCSDKILTNIHSE